jgi:hypothetical protein
MHPKEQQRLDRDLAILIVTAPFWLTAFVVLFVAGAISEARGGA